MSDTRLSKDVNDKNVSLDRCKRADNSFNAYGFPSFGPKNQRSSKKIVKKQKDNIRQSTMYK